MADIIIFASLMNDILQKIASSW